VAARPPLEARVRHDRDRGGGAVGSASRGLRPCPLHDGRDRDAPPRVMPLERLVLPAGHLVERAKRPAGDPPRARAHLWGQRGRIRLGLQPTLSRRAVPESLQRDGSRRQRLRGMGEARVWLARPDRGTGTATDDRRHRPDEPPAASASSCGCRRRVLARVPPARASVGIRRRRDGGRRNPCRLERARGAEPVLRAQLPALRPRRARPPVGFRPARRSPSAERSPSPCFSPGPTPPRLPFAGPTELVRPGRRSSRVARAMAGPSFAGAAGSSAAAGSPPTRSSWTAGGSAAWLPSGRSGASSWQRMTACRSRFGRAATGSQSPRSTGPGTEAGLQFASSALPDRDPRPPKL